MRNINQYITEYKGFELEEGYQKQNDFAAFVQEFNYSEAFIISPIETEEFISSTIKNLNNITIKYTLTKKTPIAIDNLFSYYTTAIPINRYNSEIFRGILIDTDAAKVFIGGYNQFKTYIKCVNSNAVIDTNTAGNITIQFGVGSATSVKTLRIDTSIGAVDFHIFDKSTPFFYSFRNLDRLDCYFNNIINKVVTLRGRVFVTRQYSHLFVL